jgi:hypothetical protein
LPRILQTQHEELITDTANVLITVVADIVIVGVIVIPPVDDGDPSGPDSGRDKERYADHIPSGHRPVDCNANSTRGR